MSYGKFATIYDQLMSDAPYDEWVRFTSHIMEKEHLNEKNLIDLGCGTGEISVRLAQQGFRVTGVDLSSEMLAIARQKAEAAKESIQFIQQDLRDLESNYTFDVAVCFCDVLNYITDKQDINKIFARVHQILNKDGLFLFDVHSIAYMDFLKNNQPFSHVSDDISYVWYCSNGQDGELIYDLTFFVKDKENYYFRFDEEHAQKTYQIDHYKQWIEDNNFELINIFGDFTKEKIEIEDVDRIFFVCRKK